MEDDERQPVADLAGNTVALLEPEISLVHARWSASSNGLHRHRRRLRPTEISNRSSCGSTRPRAGEPLALLAARSFGACDSAKTPAEYQPPAASQVGAGGPCNVRIGLRLILAIGYLRACAPGVTFALTDCATVLPV